MVFKSPLKLGLLAGLTALLVACGGGGGGDASSPVSIEVDDVGGAIRANSSLMVTGSATSQPNALASASWTVSKLSASAPDMAVANGDCAVATKNSRTVNSTTRSTWSCSAVITAAANASTGDSYRVTFSGTDDKGNASSSYSDIVVSTGVAGPSASAPTATSQASLIVLAGDDVNLNCLAAGGSVNGGSDYRIQWVVKSNTAGLPLSTMVDDNGTLSFKAPFVRSATSVTFQCRVTDDNLATGTSDTLVVVNPGSTVAAVANAGFTQSVTSGEVVSLDGTASAAEGNPVLYYTWSQTGGPAVTLTSPSSASPSFVAPAVTSTTAFTFRLVAQVSPNATSSAAPSEVAIATVYVSPEAQMDLTVTAAQTVSQGSPVSITVGVTPGGTYFYEWTQVSGPAVTLGGANTATTSFIAPASAGADLLFSVKVARTPIADAAPEDIKSTDVVVRVD